MVKPARSSSFTLDNTTYECLYGILVLDSGKYILIFVRIVKEDATTVPGNEKKVLR